MTVKVLGAGNGGEDSIGILGDSFSGVGPGAAENGAQYGDEVAADDVDELELLEFLAADLDPVPADPAFRQQLSDLLWDMVCDGRAARNRNH